MEEKKAEKMVIIATHGNDDPDGASLPFVVGNAALATDVEVIIALQGVGVTLANKGCYERIFAGGLDPLKKLADTFLELGGQIWVCTPCLNSRQIPKESLLDGIQLMAGGKLVQACLEADAMLNFDPESRAGPSGRTKGLPGSRRALATACLDQTRRSNSSGMGQ